MNILLFSQPLIWETSKRVYDRNEYGFLVSPPDPPKTAREHVYDKDFFNFTKEEDKPKRAKSENTYRVHYFGQINNKLGVLSYVKPIKHSPVIFSPQLELVHKKKEAMYDYEKPKTNKIKLEHAIMKEQQAKYIPTKMPEVNRLSFNPNVAHLHMNSSITQYPKFEETPRKITLNEWEVMNAGRTEPLPYIPYQGFCGCKIIRPNPLKEDYDVEFYSNSNMNNSQSSNNSSCRYRNVFSPRTKRIIKQNNLSPRNESTNHKEEEQEVNAEESESINYRMEDPSKDTSTTTTDYSIYQKTKNSMADDDEEDLFCNDDTTQSLPIPIIETGEPYLDFVQIKRYEEMNETF